MIFMGLLSCKQLFAWVMVFIAYLLCPHRYQVSPFLCGVTPLLGGVCDAQLHCVYSRVHKRSLMYSWCTVYTGIYYLNGECSSMAPRGVMKIKGRLIEHALTQQDVTRVFISWVNRNALILVHLVVCLFFQCTIVSCLRHIKRSLQLMWWCWTGLVHVYAHMWSLCIHSKHYFMQSWICFLSHLEKIYNEMPHLNEVKSLHQT